MKTSLIQKLQDIPRWVEVRALLHEEEARVFGVLEKGEDISFMLQDENLLFIIGKPDFSTLQKEILNLPVGAEIIAAMEEDTWLAEMLPAWTRSRILIHQLTKQNLLPEDNANAVRFLDPELIPRLEIDPELKAELAIGAQGSQIAAAFIEGKPVAFCYAGAVTETLWDVAIDTLLEFQNKGYASLCAGFMIRYMRAQGKEPVWQSLEENPASWRLAQKLGFSKMDEMLLFTRRADS